MKISQRMKKLLNDQITMEGYASSYYLSMASWAEITGYDGAAKYFYAQSDEERQHMLKIIHFLNELGVEATIPAIKQPPKSFKSFESL
ncbi:MAG TPA: ferritin-like domain-containing protein, partial [Nitrosopumilaceae archaeon]|nr:ferritin-like domain-containing protein [Nitrosopumilaceae archaeon]